MIVAILTIVLPMTNTVPSVGLALMAAGLIQRDGPVRAGSGMGVAAGLGPVPGSGGGGGGAGGRLGGGLRRTAAGLIERIDGRAGAS